MAMQAQSQQGPPQQHQQSYQQHLRPYVPTAPNPDFTGLLAGHTYYVETGLLGKGTFGTVIKAVDTRYPAEDPELIAIKFIPRGQLIKNYKTYIKREILHHSCLRHPLVICLKEVFLTPSHVAIAMEYAPGGDLFTYVTEKHPNGKLREDQARWVFQQLVIGLDYCHKRGVANRDLKLENLLLDQDGSNGFKPLLKICDFGFSKHESNSTAKTSVGTALYMAPEVLIGCSKYDAKTADIWSCGIVLYAMLCGRYPFDTKAPVNQDNTEFVRRTVQAQFTLPDSLNLSADCRELLCRMLVPKPTQRITLEEIKRHPWFVVDLPPGALDMNDVLLNESSSMTDYESMISAIVDEAVVDASQLQAYGAYQGAVAPHNMWEHPWGAGGGPDPGMGQMGPPPGAGHMPHPGQQHLAPMPEGQEYMMRGAMYQQQQQQGGYMPGVQMHHHTQQRTMGSGGSGSEPGSGGLGRHM